MRRLAKAWAGEERRGEAGAVRRILPGGGIWKEAEAREGISGWWYGQSPEEGMKQRCYTQPVCGASGGGVV